MDIGHLKIVVIYPLLLYLTVWNIWGYDVFSSCKNLREIYVPESVERVQVEVFGNGIFDNYKNIAVPNHLSGMFIYNGRARIKYY